MKPLSITAKRMLRRAVAAFCACACVFAVSACGADETGKIRIGIKFDQPGLGFKKNGTYVGFDVDVAKYVAKKLGYSEDEIVWKESPSKQREAMLQNGDVDYIVASYSITDERKKVVDFAGPYFVAGQDLLVRKDETGIDGPKDLNGKRLCSMTGTTSAVNVKEKFAKQTQLMEQPGMRHRVAFRHCGRRHHRRHHSRRPRIRLTWTPARGGQAVHPGVLRHRCQEGQHRAEEQNQQRHHRYDSGRFLAKGHFRQHQGSGLHAERQVQSAGAEWKGE